MTTLLERYPVSPKHYTLHFAPNLKTFTFDGTASVTLVVHKPVDTFVLNAAELKITDCEVLWKEKKLSCVFSLNEHKEELTIKLPEKIEGDAELLLRFSGVLNDNLLGFYRSQYKDADGKPLVLATTQLEAADARRVFPCWDEPAAKATFDVTLTVDHGLRALSNMPVIERKEINGTTVFRFERTPIMSTYLLYLAVGEFEYLEAKEGAVDIRIVTTHGKKARGKLALELTRKFLSYFNDYFGIPYPLPKLDMIAIPDFASGAMENWGAITFREAMLLFDVATSSQQTKQDIAEVIAHELAHQWFGNLVTMRWWNDLWLNESFATFMATKAVDHFYPEWMSWDHFLKSATSDSMSLDALHNSHPINVDVKHPAEVREIFDNISYGKGGSVLRMLEDFVGEEHFRKGLHLYLSQYKYANATTHDLWNALAQASGKPVDAMMNTWVNQVGYPLVAVHGGAALELSQERFFLDGKHGKSGEWHIPLSVGAGKETVRTLMTTKSTNLNVTSALTKINLGQKGFYRVQYDEEHLEMLKKFVAQKKISAVDRWGVQHDLYAFCLSGSFSVKQYLEFVANYAQDDDYLASSDAASNLYTLFVLSSGEAFWNKLIENNRAYFLTVFKRLGWDASDGEKTTDKLYRSFVLSALGRHGDEKILAEARRRFDLFLKNPKTLVADIRSPVYSLTAWGGDAATHDQLIRLYLDAPTAEEKVRLLSALSHFKSEALLRKTLEFGLSADVRSQDLIVPISGVANNPYGRALLWPWMKKHWKAVASKYGVGNPLLNKTIGCLASTTDLKAATEIEEFFAKNPVPGTARKIAQTVEKIKISARLMKRMKKEFG